jgi:hypothetical protein
MLSAGILVGIGRLIVTVSKSAINKTRPTSSVPRY